MAETVLGFRIEVKGTDKQTSDIARLEQGLIKLRQERTRLQKKVKAGEVLTASESKSLATLRTKISATTTEIKKQTQALKINGQEQKKATSFTQKLGKSIVGAGVAMFGIGAAIGLVTRLVSGAVSIFIDFEKANSKLEAVLGANEEQMASLSDQAKELGSSTAFTATQVTELQTEFAKLGFPTQDILNMTEATLDGAAALGSGLGEQAALTGALLKQYGLEAKDATEVNDILATAASNSALDFQKLSTALPIVGATANAVGKDLKQTTELLGILADRGLDASTSGTSLRNVFLELSKQGLTMEQAMAKINGSTDKAKTSMELFGKRGATTGLILADVEGQTTKLGEALEDTNGKAKEMADTMLDNLAGDVTKAQSAWEGFILSLEDGGGTINKVLRTTTKGATGMLNVFTNFKSTGNLFADVTASILKTRAGIHGVTEAGKRLSETPLHKALELKQFELASERLGLIASGADQTGESFLLLEAKIKKVNEALAEAPEPKTDEEIKAQNDKIIAAEQVAAVKEELDEKEIAANAKKNEKIAANNEKAAKKEINNQIKVQQELDDLAIASIENDRVREEAELVAAFEKKIATIKGDSAKEIELRKGLKAQLETVLNEQQEEFDLIDEEKAIEARALELENQLTLAGEDFEARRLVLEQQRSLELEQTKLTKSQVDVINKKFNEIQKADDLKILQIKESQRQFELGATANALNAAAGLMKKGSIAQKVLASGAAIINTYAAATAALAPPPLGLGPIFGPLAAGTAIATGLANVTKINNVKFQDGGYVDGASHSDGGIQMFHKSGQHIGEMEGNEYIMSSSTVDRIGINNLDAMNFGGGTSNGFFAHGGSVPNVTGLSSSIPQSVSNPFNMEDLADLISVQMQSVVNRLEVVNNATDTARVAASVNNIETDLSFG